MPNVLSEYEKLIVPIHNGGHWTLIVVDLLAPTTTITHQTHSFSSSSFAKNKNVSKKLNEIKYYDSVKASGIYHIKKLLATFDKLCEQQSFQKFELF